MAGSGAFHRSSVRRAGGARPSPQARRFLSSMLCVVVLLVLLLLDFSRVVGLLDYLLVVLLLWSCS